MIMIMMTSKIMTMGDSENDGVDSVAAADGDDDNDDDWVRKKMIMMIMMVTIKVMNQ